MAAPKEDPTVAEPSNAREDAADMAQVGSPISSSYFQSSDSPVLLSQLQMHAKQATMSDNTRSLTSPTRILNFVIPD